VFETPLRIDTGRTEAHARPEAWGKGEPVQVLPLRAASPGHDVPGWCSYADQLAEAPDVEILCGGINSKAESAAAVWRQGNLLHFGFDLTPDEMNESGRALLVNAIVYIARFRGDRTILRMPSPFAGKSTRSRAALGRWLLNENVPLDWFTQALATGMLDGVDTKDRGALQAWFTEHQPALRPGEQGRLVVDEDVRALGCGYDAPGFFASALAALDDTGKADAAARALARFVPDGPGAAADRAAWKTWLAANEPYLFFSEWGGYRWYVDPLAKARGVPTTTLRGPARSGA